MVRGGSLARALLGALLVAALALLAPAAGAGGGRGTVLLIEVPRDQGGWPEAEARASAELQALGFTVVRARFREPSRALHADQLNPLVCRTGALAAVRFLRAPVDPGAGAAVAVFVVDRSTGRSRSRSVGPERVDETVTAEQAALLASELVYSTLVRVRAPEPAPKPEPEPTAEPEPQPAPIAAPAPRWAVRAGALAAASPAGASPTAGVLVGGAWLFHEQVGVDLQLDTAVIPAIVSGPEGRARLLLHGARAHARFVAWPTGPVSLSLGLGAGLLLASISARAEPPYQASSDAGAVAVLSASSQLDLDLGSGARLFAALRAGLAVPELRVSFAGSEAARVGRPLADLSSGIELRW